MYTVHDDSQVRCSRLSGLPQMKHLLVKRDWHSMRGAIEKGERREVHASDQPRHILEMLKVTHVDQQFYDLVLDKGTSREPFLHVCLSAEKSQTTTSCT